MVFSSLTFLQCFLPVCLLAYFLVPQKWRNGVLFLFSLLFYAWGEPVYVVLMLFYNALDYTCGQMVERHRGQQGAKIALLVSVCVNLGLGKLCFSVCKIHCPRLLYHCITEKGIFV